MAFLAFLSVFSFAFCIAMVVRQVDMKYRLQMVTDALVEHLEEHNKERKNVKKLKEKVENQPKQLGDPYRDAAERGPFLEKDCFVLVETRKNSNGDYGMSDMFFSSLEQVVVAREKIRQEKIAYPSLHKHEADVAIHRAKLLVHESVTLEAK